MYTKLLLEEIYEYIHSVSRVSVSPCKCDCIRIHVLARVCACVFTYVRVHVHMHVYVRVCDRKCVCFFRCSYVVRRNVEVLQQHQQQYLFDDKHYKCFLSNIVQN